MSPMHCSKRSKEINPEEYESLGLSKEHLQRTVLDLFMAGFITGLETLMWGLTCLAKNPEIQKKVQAELDEVLSGRFPTVDDRQATPYTDATILEIFRVNSLTPFSLAHGTTQDCVFEGYFVPKGAVVLPLIWAHHNDPAIFPEPEIFRPERFIGENGTVDVDFAQNVVPFGVGKRRCVGENLARQEIYLIFASTMQQYEISLPSDEDINFDRDIIDGIITIVKPSNFIFKRRH